MPIIIKPDSFDHWLKLKTEDVSSTEVSALFGISPYSTEFELWHQKDSGEVFTLQDNERMLCGRTFEEPIAKMVADQLGIKVRRLKTYFRHDHVPHMSSSFDYEIVGDNSKSQLFINNPELSGSGLLEIKNVDSLIYRDEWDDDEAPPHIEAQVQHQMETANRNWTLIAALVGGNRLKMILRMRDREVGTAIANRITKFWSDIDDGIAPEPDFDLDAAFICELYTNVNADRPPLDISDDIGLKSLVIAWKELRDRYNELEKATTAIKAEVIHRVGNVPRLISSDGLTVNMTMTKATLPTTVTEDMVGTEIGGSKGWRQFRITQRDMSKKRNKPKKPEYTDEDVII